MSNNSQQTGTCGWREWLALPDIDIPGIEANIDTGSESSTLYTSFIEHYRRDGELWVRFGVNPLPQRDEIRIVCQAPVISQQTIPVSEWKKETLFVIESSVRLGQSEVTTELVLNRRQDDSFSLQLGRNALKGLELLVDARQSYLFGEPDESLYKNQLKAS